jgi:5-(carboxyamino)imidazole ribonucleotide mutase
MPNGVPVATVALNAAKNAGILAAQIIGASEKEVFSRVSAYKTGLKAKVINAVKEVENSDFSFNTLK